MIKVIFLLFLIGFVIWISRGYKTYRNQQGYICAEWTTGIAWSFNRLPELLISGGCK